MRTVVAVLAVLNLAVALASPPHPTALAAEADVVRVFGSGRVQTAVELSKATLSSAPAVVLAFGNAFPDAIAAAPLAAAAGGPVLLNSRDDLHDDVRTEIGRLGASRAYVMGGEAVQGPGVVVALEAMGLEVVRVADDADPSRWGTAAEAARLAVELWRAAGDTDAGRHVIVALGNHENPSQAWPDALAAGPLAGHAHRPILLVSHISGVPEATNRALRELGAEVATIAGGPGAIPDAIADDLDVASYERLFGQSRYGTATALADAAVASGGSRGTVFAATGAAFPDGLAAGAAAYHAGGVLVLVSPADLVDSPPTKSWVEEHEATITRIRVAGGPGAVGDEVVGQLGFALGDLTLALETVASGFDFPLFATGHASEANRVYVVEKGGAIWIVEGGSRLSTPFFDLRGQVSTGGEQGLLGLAFHPSYPTDPRVYVHYTNQAGNTRVVEYRRSTANSVDTGSARTLLSLDQPFSNHNGGMLEFGPDGALYVSLGDGGSGGDPQGNAQNTGNLLGSIVRIDVGSGSRTLWMHGLRNPWRFSFDPPEGLVYVGDVGQNSWEEVDVAAWNARGTNFGWNVMEGKHCFQPSSGCNTSGLTLPVLEYPLGQGGTCAVTGGYVYRGDAIPELRGQYLYADFCAGWVRSFHYRRGVVSDERDWTSQLGDLGNIPSFGTDSAGEILITSTNGGVHRIVRGA